ncbi:MAG: sorbosone dehydrogenase family protein [Bacteroidota bacterium]
MKKIGLITGLAVLMACSAGLKEAPNSTQVEKAPETALTSAEGLELDDLYLPEGFEIEVFARVNNARSMVLSPSGTLYVGNRGGGKVYAVKDTNGDWKADEIFTIAEDLRLPNGIAFKDGSLYVAEVSKLWRYDDIEQDLSNAPKPELIYDDLPTERHHGWKYIAFGPDGKLYVPVGAPCNICESEDERFASILRMNADGSAREIYARGVRNTVGFTWHPETNEMWFTDNGRDRLGDDEPPCELNRVATPGAHYGYPYCHGGYLSDPEFGSKFPCEDFVKPVQNLGPHVAPLGIKFCVSDVFPEEFKNAAFIAEHGSWNRSPKAGHTGHKVTLVRENKGVGTTYEDFITGFLNTETNTAWARPVDILFAPDGSMLISDDLAGTIFRVFYSG